MSRESSTAMQIRVTGPCGPTGGEGGCWPSELVQLLGGVGIESGYDDVDFGDAWREAVVGGQAEDGANCHPGGVGPATRRGEWRWAATLVKATAKMTASTAATVAPMVRRPRAVSATGQGPQADAGDHQERHRRRRRAARHRQTSAEGDGWARGSVATDTAVVTVLARSGAMGPAPKKVAGRLVGRIGEHRGTRGGR